MGNNVKTNIQVSEMRTLYYYTKQVNDSSIKTVSLNSYEGKNLLRSYRTSSGQSALIPAAGIDNYTKIQEILDTLLAPANTTQQ
jgi:hypothetical protein